jgi:gamma-glutamyltranspeptidase/glutathione hydrolase
MTNEWRWMSRPGLAGPHGGAARPVIMGRRGAVAAAHPLAALAGVDVLTEGGNAFDAAVVVSSLVSLGEPHMSGIGGIGTMTVYHAASDSTMSLKASGPRVMIPPGERKETGAASAAAPGVVAGWAAMLEKYGTMKLDRLLRPAIEHARNGVPVSFMLSAVIEAVASATGPYKATKSEGFSADTGAAARFTPGGRPLRPGQPLVQKELAGTLEAIAREGARAFYKGRIAKQISETSAAAGGHITEGVLGEVEAEWKPSLKVVYRGYGVYSNGPQLLETLGLLEGFDLGSMEMDSPEHLHALIECLKQAQADQVAHGGDRTFDSSSLLESAYLDQRRQAIDPARATAGVGDEPVGKLSAIPAGTTHFVVADSAGNLVSWMQSLGNHFGCRVIAGDTGVMLNNVYRSATPATSSAGPAVVLTAEGAPWMTVGSVGGPGIPQTAAQMISRAIDFRLNPQTALEAPRLRVFKDFRVMVESRVPQSTRDELERRGHECDVVGEWAFGEGQLGRGQMILRDASGTLMAGSDPRADGVAQAR